MLVVRRYAPIGGVGTARRLKCTFLARFVVEYLSVAASSRVREEGEGVLVLDHRPGTKHTRVPRRTHEASSLRRRAVLAGSRAPGLVLSRRGHPANRSGLPGIGWTMSALCVDHKPRLDAGAHTARLQQHRRVCLSVFPGASTLSLRLAAISTGIARRAG